MQSYAPFRTTLIGPGDLRELTTLRPATPVIHALLRWVLMLTTWSITAIWTHPAVVIVAVVVVGVNYYGLLIIGHDGLHRRLFDSKQHNDLFNDLLILGPVGAITRINRVNHMEHHRVTCLASDPDRHKYVHAGKQPIIPFMVFVTGLANLAPTLRNIFNAGGETSGSAARANETYTARDLAILIGWQVALIGGLSYFVGWWAYPVLWLLPVYAFAYRADLTRVFCEHAMLTTDSDADADLRLVTYRSNWIELQFFAPHNMNYHMPHHLWPSVPYYNLPKADLAIRDAVAARGEDSRLVWRDSYLVFMARYARWRLSADRSPTAASQA